METVEAWGAHLINHNPRLLKTQQKNTCNMLSTVTTITIRSSPMAKDKTKRSVTVRPRDGSPADGSPAGRFARGRFARGRFARGTVRPRDGSPAGRFARGTDRPRDAQSFNPSEQNKSKQEAF